MPYYLVAASASALAIVFFLATLKMQEAAAETPRLVAMLLVGLAVAMLIEVHLYRRGGAAAVARVDEAARPHLGPFFEGIDIRRVFVFVTAIILYVVLLEPVGYFIVTPLFTFGIFVYLRACRPWVAAVVSVAVPVFIYFLFVAFLDLPVPMGVLG